MRSDRAPSVRDVARRRDRGCRSRVALALALAVGLAAAGTATVPTEPPAPPTPGPRTERLLLSGSGVDDPVDWDFRCDVGRRCGEWSRIAVPAQWQQEGFGVYHYGHDDEKTPTVGLYRTRFEVPAAWAGRRIDLVFDGVMTDAAVRIDGVAAGPVHRGGFTRFRYDVGERVRPGGSHQLEVEVSEVSADRSVELAERDADYWVFGGIYRPVFLEARPAESIAWTAVDARHDGRIGIRVEAEGLAASGSVRARVLDAAGTVVGELGPAVVEPESGGTIRLDGTVAGILPWSAEEPILYRLETRLERDGAPLHVVEERIGFRTVEWPPGAGLRINGRRTVLRGVNRHAFWPDSGRTGSPSRDRRDVELLKALGANAVRCAHYPPDVSFLEAADELGLYVLDELPGWHDAYSRAAGTPLVEEMVRRDVDHPAIVAWVNGNEGGSNARLDAVFAAFDPQGRPVLHSRQVRGGFDTSHYPSWAELGEALDPGWLGRLRGRHETTMLFTEILHGLYGGGSGAALGEWWERLREHPRFAGAFLWSFSDEAVERTDRGRELDADGNHGPDGVLGPRREWTSTADAVRAIWASVRFEAAGGSGGLRVENRHDHRSLAGVSLHWSWWRLGLPLPGEAPLRLSAGEAAAPAIAAGASAVVRVDPPPEGAEALVVEARGNGGSVLGSRWFHSADLPWESPEVARSGPRHAGPATPSADVPVGAAEVRETGPGVFRLEGGGTVVELDPSRGTVDLEAAGASLRLEGPFLPDGTGPETVAVGPVRGVVGPGLEVRLRAGRLRWELAPSGWLRLSWLLEHPRGAELRGVAFRTGRGQARSVEWLGDGPGRVWRNRPEGGILGRWLKNVEEPDTTPPGDRGAGGFRRRWIWARLGFGAATGVSDDVRLLLANGDPEVALATPGVELGDDPRDAVAALPAGDFALLSRLSAIGTKFHPARDLSPLGRLPESGGPDRGVVWLRVAPERAPDQAPAELGPLGAAP